MRQIPLKLEHSIIYWGCRIVALSRTVSLVVCRRNLWQIPKRRDAVACPENSVAKLSVPHALSNFRTSAHPETLSRPNDSGVMPHPAGRVNGQESPSAGNITTASACVGMSCEEETVHLDPRVAPLLMGSQNSYLLQMQGVLVSLYQRVIDLSGGSIPNVVRIRPWTVVTDSDIQTKDNTELFAAEMPFSDSAAVARKQTVKCYRENWSVPLHVPSFSFL
jgi:hypothetical protein